eukprot:GHVU01208350.1.p1 GENE.GHVU01208350.1~~GHVU01208350.1.p1  ORF type:complete len:204 (+),score=11.81 GHVU01208350.1:271-882(+)
MCLPHFCLPACDHDRPTLDSFIHAAAAAVVADRTAGRRGSLMTRWLFLSTDSLSVCVCTPSSCRVSCCPSCPPLSPSCPRVPTNQSIATTPPLLPPLHRSSHHSTTQKKVYPVNSIDFHLGHVFSTGGADGSIALWDKNERVKTFAFVNMKQPIVDVSFNQTGKLVAYAMGYDWHKGYQHGQQCVNKVMVHGVQENMLRKSPS